MTDNDVVKLLRKIDKLNRKISDIVFEIEESDHPKAHDIVLTLRDNYFDNPAWATHCGRHRLKGWYPTYVSHLGITRQKSKATYRDGTPVDLSDYEY